MKNLVSFLVLVYKQEKEVNFKLCTHVRLLDCDLFVISEVTEDTRIIYTISSSLLSDGVFTTEFGKQK